MYVLVSYIYILDVIVTRCLNMYGTDYCPAVRFFIILNSRATGVSVTDCVSTTVPAYRYPSNPFEKLFFINQ